MAAHSKFKPEYVEQARNYCELGATDVQLAKFFGTTERSITTWKQKHPAFAEALTAGKEVADKRVENALFHRATGYSHEAVKIHVGKDGDVTKVDYTEHYPPDTVACIFWLKNRKKEAWRDRHELTGDADSPLVVKVLKFAGDPAPE